MLLSFVAEKAAVFGGMAFGAEFFRPLYLHPLETVVLRVLEQLCRGRFWIITLPRIVQQINPALFFCPFFYTLLKEYNLNSAILILRPKIELGNTHEDIFLPGELKIK
jgi:hypothetical protein